MLSQKIKPISWSEPSLPNESIGYDHIIGTTPIGRFVVTWKGWKEYDPPAIDETPWGEFGGVAGTVAEAKEECWCQYHERVSQCLA